LALVFSPIAEDVLLASPRTLYPKTAFIMRQIGRPPALDEEMRLIVEDVFKARGLAILDADGSTGSKDFLERILGLIRGTAFTAAIFSKQTRSTAMANIALELGFASMLGKPLMIIKSKGAPPPSDLTRTDWIEYDPADEARFRRKLNQAIDELDQIAVFTSDLLDLALRAPAMDCAVAFERASKAFLMTGDARYIAAAQAIESRLAAAIGAHNIDDLERVRGEVALFIEAAHRAHCPGD
jgi:hypothetical protein